MAGFYSEMADMARELLAPEAEGGLGQGLITVIRTEGTEPPEGWPTWEPWPGVETTKTFRLYGVVSGVAKELVDGTTILASDMVLTVADRMTLIETKVDDDPATASSEEVTFSLGVPEAVNIDGVPFTTLQRVPVPGAGVKAAHKFIIRG